MSFFDTLRCDYPLPDPEFQERTFHTLNFRCLLDHYCLGTDGRLRQIHRKLYNPQGKPAAHPPASEDTGYHGDLRFHSQVPARRKIAYVARFSHGTVEWIRRVEQEEPAFADSLEHLARDARYLGQEREVQWSTCCNAWRSSTVLSPYEALAQGNRKTVLRMLEQIDAALWLVAVQLDNNRR